MGSWDLEHWLTIISSLSAAIVSIINALKTEKIHNLVNGRAYEAKIEIASLKDMLRVKQGEIDNFNKEL